MKTNKPSKTEAELMNLEFEVRREEGKDRDDTANVRDAKARKLESEKAVQKGAAS